MNGKMSEEEYRQLRSRLRRLAGQAQSLERILAEEDSVKLVGQIEAVIAASQAALVQFAELKLIESEEEADRALLLRLIRRH